MLVAPLLSFVMALARPAPGVGGIDLARDAVSTKASAPQAAAKLRARGPVGLDAMFTAHAKTLETGPADPSWSRVTAAITRVSAQHDGWASHLYWYTELERAKAAARETGRPILSLRLLGRLDEELSCANSRFIRTTLYPDESVAPLLRDRFVLHWATERPAPRITIDYGDGRVLVRTITGNSIHYVLDAEGRPVDALPGLWGPAGFARALTWSLELERSLRGLAPEARAQTLASAHQSWLGELDREWPEPLFAVSTSRGRPATPVAGAGTPDAGAAAPLAVSKVAIQAPLVGAWLGDTPAARLESFLMQAPPEVMERARADARLGENSKDLLRILEGPGSGAPHAAGQGAAAAAAQRAFQDALAAFESSIADDQIQNRFLIGRRIHEWFAATPGPGSLEALNQRVYDELFLTPRSDPWLGLAPPGVLTGLSRGGLVEPERSKR